MTTPGLAFVRVLAVICEKHGRLDCYGTDKKYTLVPGVLLAADELRRGSLRCRSCKREGSDAATLRFETEPVSAEYVRKNQPQIVKDRAKLAAWMEAVRG